VLAGLGLAFAGCSGDGVSTTARTVGGDQDGSDSAAGDATDAADGGDTMSPVTSGPSSADATGLATDGGSATSAATDDGPSDSGPPPQVDLEGAWLSEGDNVAPLLVELTDAVQITAVFSADTFTVTTIDGGGQEVVQVGVYTDSPSGVGGIFDITLQQSSPASATARGIYEIDDSVEPAVLRYEIVQTEPSVGAIPPTAEGGFGSTSYGADLTQIYLRQ
jgi:hypothetical protein